MLKYFYLILIVTVSLTFEDCSSNSPKFNLDKNREVVRKYHEIWSNGKVEQLNTILAPDLVGHAIGGLEYKGIEGAKNEILENKKAFPDWNEIIVDMIAEGDKVVTRFRSTGTHRVRYDGIDSTGNKIDIFETAIFRIENGKIAEQWGFWDEITFRQQLTARK